MLQNVDIDIHHLTRVEGHGNIVVNVAEGTIERCEWQVPESPRFFEAMVRGRHYSEVARITSRICGICAVGHTLASVTATEAALGIEPSPQTRKLRRLLKHAENFDSHVLHVYLLVAPDLFDAPSVFPLIPTHGEVVVRALRLKRLAHEWGSLIGGRTTHPVTVVPGGFSRVPTEQALAEMRERLITAVPDLEATVETIASVAHKIPVFDRPTEYIAVSEEGGYGMFAGKVQAMLADGDRSLHDVSDYLAITNEYVVPQSTAKYTKNRLDSYAVGALARFNVNYDGLCPEAKEAAEALGIRPVCTNPYMNPVAQVVEIVHSAYEGIRLIEELLDEGVRDEAIVEPTRAGRGVSAVEVPRGLLFHDYTYDADGLCVQANCIIPTNQNHGNIQTDFERLVPQLLEGGSSEEQMAQALSMLVRAYDPCISCSTHHLDVEFVSE